MFRIFSHLNIAAFFTFMYGIIIFEQFGEITLHTEEGLVVLGVDLLDATPVLDIKPYVPEFDVNEQCRIGWLEGRAERADAHRSDERFSAGDGK